MQFQTAAAARPKQEKKKAPPLDSEQTKLVTQSVREAAMVQL